MDQVNTIGSGTVAGALEYLEFLSTKGHVAPGAVTALKTAFKKVMETVGGSDWDKADIRAIDLDEHMNRFGNMTHGRYNAKSLLDYKSRVNKVLTWYAEFLKTPGWTPDIKPRKRTSAQKEAIKNAVNDNVDTMSENTRDKTVEEVAVQATPSRSNLVAFPFPLSDGSLASLYLPPTLSANDAERMARFVETLVVERSK